MATTESLNSASSRAGRYVFSVAHQRDVRPRTRAQGTHDVTTPTTPTHNKGWRFATESPWTRWHTGGPGKDTHGRPVPEPGKAVGGSQRPPRRRPQTTTRQRPVSRQSQVRHVWASARALLLRSRTHARTRKLCRTSAWPRHPG